MVYSNTENTSKELFRLETWEEFFFRVPCVKKSYLWGLGCSSLMVAHKLRLYRGNTHHAISAGVLTFLAVSSVSFLVCAQQLNAKYFMIKDAFKNNNTIKQETKRS